MGNYDDLKSDIADVIGANNNQEITGSILSDVLQSIVMTIGAYSTFAGVATLKTNPGTPDQAIFYIAAEPGEYVNFDGCRVEIGELAVFTNDRHSSSWTSHVLRIFDKEIPQTIENTKTGLNTLQKDLNSEVTRAQAKENKLEEELENAQNKLNTTESVTEVSWSVSSNMNDLTTAGAYNIKGERINANDNLPISNSNPGHTVSGRLIVLDSSIDGTGDSQDKCITQLLTLSNRTREDGNTYIRTASGASLRSLTWKPWAAQQTNVNVGQVTSLDSFIDNGIYSGVFVESGVPTTFVMIVLNDYFVGLSPRRV